jgi:hypothetical protein
MRCRQRDERIREGQPSPDRLAARELRVCIQSNHRRRSTTVVRESSLDEGQSKRRRPKTHRRSLRSRGSSAGGVVRLRSRASHPLLASNSSRLPPTTTCSRGETGNVCPRRRSCRRSASVDQVLGTNPSGRGLEPTSTSGTSMFCIGGIRRGRSVGQPGDSDRRGRRHHRRLVNRNENVQCTDRAAEMRTQKVLARLLAEVDA